MAKHPKNKATRHLFAASALVVGVVGAAMAAPADHQKIVLKDPAGNALTQGSTTAFSIKTTCFGAAGCHGGAGATGNAVYTYDQIESTSYHSSLGANEFRGFNPANPDSSDAFRKGAGPKGKNWVQSPGHLGSW
jgi:hypothetical protein